MAFYRDPAVHFDLIPRITVQLLLLIGMVVKLVYPSHRRRRQAQKHAAMPVLTVIQAVVLVLIMWRDLTSDLTTSSCLT